MIKGWKNNLAWVKYHEEINRIRNETRQAKIEIEEQLNFAQIKAKLYEKHPSIFLTHVLPRK
jgi:hypothetical protein